ncbi:hypothetical protein HZZ00_23385 [Streptomyces sp. NEAU-sy36]|uniref:hypothetical protein n=1 Tax=unclassified Streptomyces TaxID=2593676 RepID=UPI0015D6096B|nr:MULTISPECIES: hypothetical protein [unclassified Streptomyces]QLJ03638.1 hypothetical protein HZZ00_23385 [Streptomyces sp. NEAU-sy36]
MYTRGRTLKVTAVSAMVVLALTGFSSGHGHRSHGGGGCSSSHQDHDGSSTARGSGSSGSDPDDSATSTSTGGGSRRSRPTRTPAPTPTASSSHAAARPLEDGTAVLVHCASTADPYATVEVRNPNGREGVFMVKMSFKDARGFAVADTGNEVSVPARGRATLRVSAVSTGRVEEIAHCEVDPRAVADR